MPRIGVLALQGDFAEHIHMLAGLRVETAEVRLAAQLEDIDGLIIPGGESTTIGKLAVDFGLFEPLKAYAARKAVWGTCAGAILLSRDAKREQPLLGAMDITVERNAFGRQVASFEAAIPVPALKHLGKNGSPFNAVFIRAPLIASVHGSARILARLDDGRIVAAQQGRLLATSFHPELTGDDRFHRYFLSLVS